MPGLSKIIDGKKFMWDGNIYKTEEEARKTAQEYQKNGFETHIISENGEYLVYNRREIKG